MRNFFIAYVKDEGSILTTINYFEISYSTWSFRFR
jgi:hypothetical protein